jgi:hypothetical protein
MDKVTIHVEKNGEARQESEKRRSDHIAKIHVDNLYYWFRVGEATFAIHHLISKITLIKKN